MIPKLYKEDIKNNNMQFNQGNSDIQNPDQNDAINFDNDNEVITSNINIGSAVDIKIKENEGETAEFVKPRRTLSPTNKEEHLRAQRKA